MGLLANAQKVIEVPENRTDFNFYERLPEKLVKFGLQDLTKTTDSIFIRVWLRHEIMEVRQQGEAHAIYRVHARSKEPVVGKVEFDRPTAERLLDSLLANKVLEIPDDTYQGIDGSMVFFEVATTEKYRLYSYWSPGHRKRAHEAEVIKLLSFFSEMLQTGEHRSAYLESLEPGGYGWGMSSIRVDKFLPENAQKSSLYMEVERRMKEELGIHKGTSHLNFPLLLIDGRPAYLRDLNSYESSEIKSLEILQKEDPEAGIYGTRGTKAGVIAIQTK